MKRNRLYYIIPIVVIIISCLIYVLFLQEADGIRLTKAEKDYIEANKDTVLFMGYYNTPSEKMFVKKLCVKISEDLSLNIKPFEESWENNIILLESGKLPMVSNMSMSDERLEYAMFTESLTPLLAGIYSDYKRPLDRYYRLNGKTIGLERNNIFGVLFKEKYPDIDINLKYYESLSEVKDGLAKGEIDGYISSQSYTENQLYNHFFSIQSLTDDNNHIGISKEYPELYSIMSKEVGYLIESNWDTQAQTIINFELERKLIEFTPLEKDYINSTEKVIVGIPSNNSLYLNGEEVYQGGVIPELFDKINFITGLEFSFKVDDFENLINRDDIDVVISPETLTLPATAPLFSTKLTTVSLDNVEVINELYQLESYKITMIQHDSFMNTLINKMPELDIDIAKDYNEIYNLLLNNKVDYGIIPRVIERKYATNSKMKIGGVLGEQFHYMYVINNNHTKLINIINNCIPVIDVNKIIFEEIDEDVVSSQKQIRRTVIAIIGLTFLVLIIRYVRNVYIQIINMLYKDKATNLYNKNWLEKRIKASLDQYTYFIFEPQDLEGLAFSFGENAYKTAVKYMISVIKEHLTKGEYIVLLTKEKFLLVKHVMSDENRLRFLDDLAILFDEKLHNFDINYSYKLDVSSYHYDEFKMSYDQVIKVLELGLKYSKETGKPVDYSQDIYMTYYNKKEYDRKLSSCILNELIDIEYKKIVDVNKEIYGYDINYSCNLNEYGVLSGENLITHSQRLNLEVSLQKTVLSKIIKILAEYTDDNPILFFIYLEENILTSDGFVEWLVEKLVNLSGPKLMIKVDNKTYAENIDLIESINNPYVAFIINKFGYDLKNDFNVRDYIVELVQIDDDIFVDIEEYKEVIKCIIDFCEKYKLKTMVQSISLETQYEAIRKHNIDYIIESGRGKN